MRSFASINENAPFKWGYAKAILLTAGFVAGVLLRYWLIDRKSADWVNYVSYWYGHALAHGISSIGSIQEWYNYTPFYNYFLNLAALFDGLARPLYLVKMISFIFDFGVAIVAARIVALLRSHPLAPSLAFAVVWIAPTVVQNSDVTVQCDSIWVFFILLAVYCFCREKWTWGILAFGFAFAMKAQAMFFAPLIFAMLLKRKIPWQSLLLIPVPYLLTGLPARFLGEGQGIRRILLTYPMQAGYFRELNMNAGNLWLFIPDDYYNTGMRVGLALACGVALAFALLAARDKNELTGQRIVFASALTLLLMPFFLPKMLDRYFYAFEVLMLVVVFIKPRLTWAAVAAQVSGLLAMATFLRTAGLVGLKAETALLLSTAINTVLVMFLIAYALKHLRLRNDAPAEAARVSLKQV